VEWGAPLPAPGNKGVLLTHDSNSTPRPLWILRLTAGTFLFLLVSGVYAWLYPRQLAAQWALLVHTSVGLLALAPMSLLIWKHGRKAQRFHPTRWYERSWLSGVAWTLLGVTGVALVLVGLFGADVPYRLHWLHLILGLTLGIVAALHIMREVFRSVFAQRRFVGLAMPLVAGITAVILGGGVLWYVRRQPTRPASFLPSNARSENGRTIPPALLDNSKSCARCHGQIYREWQPGAHHYSATDVFYQAVRTNYINARGPEAARYCAGCHEPITLLGGFPLRRGVQEEAAEGSSCAFCHALRDLRTRGNANYIVARPHPYLFEQSSNPVLLRISDALIRLHPEVHREDFDLKPARTAELCGTCHKQYIDKHENGFGFLQLQDQYDDWKNGPWHTNPARELQCQDCHMHKRPSSDPARDASGTIHDHRILASNSYMAELLHLPGGRRQDELVRQWMQGETVIPEIANRWPPGPLLQLELHSESAIAAGKPARIRAVVINAKVGHAFPTGPLDVIQAWLEFTVTDIKTGATIYRAGYLDASGALVGPTVQYRSYLLDRHAQPVFTHSLWDVVGARDRRAILPGMSDSTVFAFPIPRREAGTLKCTVRVLYRKFNHRSQMLLLPPAIRSLIPVITVSSATRYFPIGKPNRSRDVAAERPQ